MQTSDLVKAHGSFQILSLENGKVVWESPVQQNLILNTFWTVLIQHLNGITTTPLEVTSIEVGTGTASVLATDTALATMVVDAIVPARTTTTTKTIELEFFIVDGEMPNGTYTELGLKAGTTLITRALFDVSYVKATGRDTIIRYTLSFDAA